MQAIEQLHLTISPHSYTDHTSCHATSTFFPGMKEGLSGPGSRNKMWSSVMTALRDWSVVGGSVWRMVVILWRGECGDKRAHFKIYFYVSFVKILLS
jgi:hypothetical protein